MRILISCLFILVCFGASTFVTAFEGTNTIKDFTTDGCSMSPDGTLDQPLAFLDCCIEHDVSYWQGGSAWKRRKADREFKACLKEVAPKAVAKLYYKAVRVNGGPYSIAHYRWGYGWPIGMGYRSLNEEQLQSAQEKSNGIQASIEAFRKAQLDCLALESDIERQICILKINPVKESEEESEE